MKKVIAVVLSLVLLVSVMSVATFASVDSNMVQIVKDAYKLEDGASMAAPATLTGVITKINTPYSSSYKNITVTITIEGAETYPIMCYRLKGTSADKLVIGDTITVTGTLMNYGGTIEFAAGCTLDSVVSGGGAVIEAPEDPKEIVDAAFALEEGDSLEYEATLTGKILSIDTPYDEGYKNITVTIEVEGTSGMKELVCFRLKGDGADTLEVGHVITVVGYIKNHYGTIEFNSGCVLTEIKTGDTETDAEKILNDAYALEEGTELAYEATLTGKIVKVDTPYNATYGNISVTIEVEGFEDQPILCYRLKGEGADALALDDIITVTGTIKNHYGTIEFAQGCTLDNVVSGGGSAPVAPEDPADILDDAYALEEGGALLYTAELTGKIISVDTPYDEGYKNITVTMEVEGCEDKPIQCFRLKGEGADALDVGYTITVSGSIVNYKGKVQFNSGCALLAYEAPAPSVNLITVYLYAPEDWETANVHYWGSSLGDTSWPGVALTKDENGLWVANVPADVTGLLFNKAGDDGKTPDLTLPADGRVKYVYALDQWLAYDEEVIIEENYYVAGDEALCGVNWSPNAPENLMTEGENGIWSITYTDVAAGGYWLKVTDGTWSNCWGDPNSASPDGNYYVSVNGLSNVTVNFDAVNKLIFVDVEPIITGVTVSGTVTSYGNAEDAATVTLLHGDKEIYTTTVNADGTYAIEGVEAGEYVMQVSKANHVGREYAVVVEAADVVVDATICQLGDVTGDGKVNMKDWSVLYDHVNEISTLDDYALLCADVNNDGKQNMKDWSRLYEHVNEIDPLW